MNNTLCIFTKKFGSEIREKTVIGVTDLLLTFMGENINYLKNWTIYNDRYRLYSPIKLVGGRNVNLTTQVLSDLQFVFISVNFIFGYSEKRIHRSKTAG